MSAHLGGAQPGPCTPCSMIRLAVRCTFVVHGLFLIGGVILTVALLPEYTFTIPERFPLLASFLLFWFEVCAAERNKNSLGDAE